MNRTAVRGALALVLLPLAGCVGEASRPGSSPDPLSGVAVVGGAVVGETVVGGTVAGSAGGQAPALPETPRFTRPEHLRGLYLNAWAAGSPTRIEQLIELARKTEVNAFVIDIKDASGYVSHASEVELARQIGATGQRRIRNLSALLERLAEEGIYPIARIVIVQDPILIQARPELAIQDRDGGVWVDGKGIRWLDPHNREVWDYNIELAREVARLGFPEIQWDYVRFPDAPRAEMARAVYPAADGRDRAQVIRGLLTYTRSRLDDLDVRMTADVFGITTSTPDVGIGQVWEQFIDVVDAALPMIYPSHYYVRSFGKDHPNAYPYEIVKAALERGIERSRAVSGAGTIVPWLQDFTLGQPPYGAAEVRAQMQAAYDVGIQEWVLWNAGSRYTEDALEPNDGFELEPSIRVAGQIVPVSQRHEALGIPGTQPR